jgi:hypothetical protein
MTGVEPTEKQFLQLVLDCAAAYHWLCYHTYDSRRSAAGWLDVVCCKPPRLVIAELKVGRRRPTDAQRDWMVALAGCPGVEVFLWYPRDFPQIERVMKGA